jgi:crossover junction endodeoxyribonuclease RuvC
VTDKVRILGIDPGLSKCGYAVIDYDGRHPQSIEHGLIKTGSKEQTSKRLADIIAEIRNVILEHKPSELAIERVYVHRNVSTAIDVAMVMGAAMVLASDLGMEARQYAPLQIKRAITGVGRASKEQVQKMIVAHYGLDEMPKPADVADALAVALTHAHLRNSPEDSSVS